jgi:hypothetical protein
LEGLVGVVDGGTAYSQLLLAPRWAAAGMDCAAAVVHYPASGGYAAYRYRTHAAGMSLEITGSGDACHCHVLLPEGVEAVREVTAAALAVPFSLVQVERSHYVDFDLALPGPADVTVNW